MNSCDICVVIPAMNEAATIGSIVSEVVALGHAVIVVDDASSDNTAGHAKRAGAKVLSNLKNLGAWKAAQGGLRYAKSLGYRVVITMDADGQHPANYISALILEYQKGADVVIGQCIKRGSLGRHLTWRFFRYINSLGINDITSGFRLYNAKALHCLISPQATMLEFQCVGVLLMLRNLNLKIVETPVPMLERETGISRIFYSWSAVVYYLLYSGLLSVSKAFPTKRCKYHKRIVRTQDFD